MLVLIKATDQGVRNSSWLEEEKVTRVHQNVGCWRGLGEQGACESELVHPSWMKP